jgi:hypothetical protein
MSDRPNSHSGASTGLLVVAAALSLIAVCRSHSQSPVQPGGEVAQRPNSTGKVPNGVILVKGAWASASDALTPVPEGGQVTNNAYTNPYFGLTYRLPGRWTKGFDGPPPSDSGYYVLAQLERRDPTNGAIRASVMITAADLFFTPTGSTDALQFINFTREHLQADYAVTRPPAQIMVAGHPFVRFDYVSPAADLHWYVLATQLRCHVVQFVFTSRDLRLLEELLEKLSSLKLPEEAALGARTGGGEMPVCIKDYARPENILERVDPILTERRFNPIPVRVIIDRTGGIKHIHILSAFPEQSKAITDALHQWRFKPYLRNGHPLGVETGITFGKTNGDTPAPLRIAPSAATLPN